MTVEESCEVRWYVMRVYKNERRAEEWLSSPEGLSYFIPKRPAMYSYHGRKVRKQIPVIPGLIFVHASFRQIVTFKQSCYNGLQFMPAGREPDGRYLTVREREMDSFMRVCAQSGFGPVFFHHTDEINLEKGTRVRVHGGLFDKAEGFFVRVAGKRSRQLVVMLTGVMAVSASVHAEYLEVIADD